MCLWLSADTGVPVSLHMHEFVFLYFLLCVENVEMTVKTFLKMDSILESADLTKCKLLILGSMCVCVCKQMHYMRTDIHCWPL